MKLKMADVPRCAHNYTQALGLKNLEPTQVALGSMSLNWAGMIHHGTYELLVQHQSTPDEQTAALTQKLNNYTESLGYSLSILVYVTNLGKSLILGDNFNTLNLISKKLVWSKCINASSCKDYGCTANIDNSPPVSEPYFQFTQRSLQIFDQKCRWNFMS